MSETLIENWLNDEMDERSTSQLEEWLREDPEQLQGFFDAVKLQEELRQHHGGTPVTVTLPSQQRRGTRLVVSLCAAAALIVAALLIIPRAADPRPTADPLVWVLAGTPQVETTRIDPGPNPVAIPREQWPVETRVTTSNEPSSLRWSEDCVLDVGSGTALALRLASDRVTPKEPRSIRLKAGRLTVRLEAPAVRVDILVGASRIRAAQPAVFTLEASGPQPIGSETVLSVTRGNVELLLPDAEKRLVAAGERVSIP